MSVENSLGKKLMNNNNKVRHNIEDIKVGDTYSFEVQITEKMMEEFAALSGDYNPLHMEEGFARHRGFPGRVVHGVLMVSLFSRLVGMHLPGENGFLQSINVQFMAPVYLDDRVLVTGRVEQVSTAVNTVVIKSTIERIPMHEVLVRSKIQVGFTSFKN